MKKAFSWLKSNPVGTLLIIVALASIGVLVFVHLKGQSLKEQRLADYQSQARRLAQLRKTPIEIPPEKPDAKVRVVPITVNKVAIEELEQVYSKLDQEYTRIFSRAVQINKPGHLPMLEGLFPDPGLEAALPWDARFRYRDAFREMVMGYSPAPTYPRLNAGMPPTATEVNQALAKVESDFLQKMFPPKPKEELNAKEQADLHEQKRKKLLELYTSRAQTINIYAVTDINAPGAPFDIGAWSNPNLGQRPEMSVLWEAQVGLWIQQDLVQAISLTNRVSEPSYNVMNAPIKRLHMIRVVPGYVGIDSPGAILAGEPAATATATSNYASREKERAAIAKAAADGDVRLPDDFSKAPTGRRSNTIYDVRHAWLVVDVETRRLPEFFDNLSKVNFMTVLKMKLEDVDEYEMLQQGFVYGRNDVMRATMLIESIWLRDWTTQLMPTDVKQRLGIMPPPESQSR